MKIREAREVAVQTLYQIEMTENDWQEALSNTLDGRKSHPFLDTVIPGVLDRQAVIDQTIRTALTHWKLERLGLVDRAILRMATFELLFQDETPTAVIINEAVELGKTFGTEENGKFINGVLSRIVKERALERN